MSTHPPEIAEPTPSPEQFLKQWDYSENVGYGRPFSYWMQFAQAYADAVSKPLREELAKCGKENCFGQRVGGVAEWVRKERLNEARERISELRGELRKK